WKQAPLQAFLAESPKDIGLVFVLINGALHKITSVVFGYPGVVPGGNIITSKRVSPLQECFPLDMRIAQYTRVGCATGEIFIDEVIDDIVAKFLPDIDDKMVKSFVHRHLPRIVDAVKTATTCLLPVAAAGGIVPGFHRNTDNLV